MQYFYRCGCDTWSVALSVDCRLGLGTVLVLISTYILWLNVIGYWRKLHFV